MPTWLRRGAGPGILFLVGLAAQFSNYTSPKVAAALGVSALTWGIVAIPWRRLAWRWPVTVVDAGDPLTPSVLRFLRYVVSDDYKTPRIHVVSLSAHVKTLSLDQPYLDLEMRFFNGSPFNLRFDSAIDGRVSFEGQDFKDRPEMVSEVSRMGIPNGWPFGLVIRQWVPRPAASRIQAMAASAGSATFDVRLDLGFARVLALRTDECSRGLLSVGAKYDVKLLP